MAWKRTPQMFVDYFPQTSFPSNPIPGDVDAKAVLSTAVAKLNSKALQVTDLHKEPFWRDILALTGTFRTLNEPSRIASAWNDLTVSLDVGHIQLIPPSVNVTRIGPGGFIVGAITFKVGGRLSGNVSGALSVVPDGTGNYKIWFLTTCLESIDGMSSPDVLDKVTANGASTNGTHTNGINGDHDCGTAEVFDCAVIGAGTSGLSTLGRLKALGLKAVGLERHATVGEVWTRRYDSVVLHTTKHYATFPFAHNTYHGEEYPKFLRAKDIARGFRRYVDDYGLDVRCSSLVESATWSSMSNDWLITVAHGDDVKGQLRLRARHIIFATGMVSHNPYMPEIANKEVYRGDVMHSADYHNAGPWKGKHGIVIGTANTGHDLAEDMVNSKLASATMVQRGSTPLVPAPAFDRFHCSQWTADTDISKQDRKEFTMPFPVASTLSRTGFAAMAKANADVFNGLEARGFKTSPPNIIKILYERVGGHYLDVGASKRIIDGEINVKNGEIESFTETGLRFKDGSTLDGDVIIFATGFRFNLREQATSVCGKEVGELLEDGIGLGEDFEMRGNYRPHGKSQIWFAAGDFARSRFYSRFLAMQIKADIQGRPFIPYQEKDLRADSVV